MVLFLGCDNGVYTGVSWGEGEGVEWVVASFGASALA